MIDIYSDEILTAPPRVVHRVKAALAMTSEAEFCKAMEDALIAERESVDAVIVPKLSPSALTLTAAERVMLAVEQLGEARQADIMACTGLGRDCVSYTTIALRKAGKLVIRKQKGIHAALYRIAGVEAQSGPPDAVAASLAVYGAGTNGYASMGENVGVL